jgi:hypothetical protein
MAMPCIEGVEAQHVKRFIREVRLHYFCDVAVMPKGHVNIFQAAMSLINAVHCLVLGNLCVRISAEIFGKDDLIRPRATDGECIPHNSPKEKQYFRLTRGQAEAIVEKLSDLLRLTLEDVEAQEVPLWRELEFLRLYLSIEQVRFEDRLKVRIVATAGLPEMLGASHGVAADRGERRPPPARAE